MWKTDGTDAGTVPVVDSDARSLAPFGNLLLFQAAESFMDFEIWRSDGTAAGTTTLTEGSSNSANPEQAVVFGGAVISRRPPRDIRG